MASAGFARLEPEILEDLDTDAHIAYPREHGAYLYNSWRDAGHARGLWRHPPLKSYRTEDPGVVPIALGALDALASTEDENWIWSDSAALRVLRDVAPTF